VASTTTAGRNKVIVSLARQNASSLDARETSRPNLAKRIRKDRFI